MKKREEYITRTVKTSLITAICVDEEKNEIVEEYFYHYGKITKDEMPRFIEEHLRETKPSLHFSYIKNVDETDARYRITLKQFMEIAQRI